jgi:hypothetical protein
MSPNRRQSESQSQSGDSPGRALARREAKTEPGNELKIEPGNEPGNEPSAGPLTMHRPRRSRLRSRVAPTVAGGVTDLLELAAARALPRIIRRETLEHRSLLDAHSDGTLAAARRTGTVGVSLRAGSRDPRVARDRRRRAFTDPALVASRDDRRRARRDHANTPDGEAGCGKPIVRRDRETSTTQKPCRGYARVLAADESDRTDDDRYWSGCSSEQPRLNCTPVLGPCSPTPTTPAPRPGSPGGAHRKNDESARAGSQAHPVRRSGTRAYASAVPRSTPRGAPQPPFDDPARQGVLRTKSTALGRRAPAQARSSVAANRARNGAARPSTATVDLGIPSPLLARVVPSGELVRARDHQRLIGPAQTLAGRRIRLSG